MALSKEWYDAEFVDSESESLHRAPSIEYSFYNAVKTGDMEYVIKNCKEDAFIHLEGTGVLSRNTLQNIKYHFVVTTAMITRYCIDGGLEPEQAYRLSDFYILKMDSCSTVRQVADLHHEMAPNLHLSIQALHPIHPSAQPASPSADLHPPLHATTAARYGNFFFTAIFSTSFHMVFRSEEDYTVFHHSI